MDPPRGRQSPLRLDRRAPSRVHDRSPKTQEQLTKNLATARELGAQVINTADVDLVHGVLRVSGSERHPNRRGQDRG